MNQRCRQLAAVEEDELMALQDEMHAAGVRPAATVTRVRRPAPPPPPAAADDDQGSSGAASAAMARMEAQMRDLLGDVRERKTAPGAPAPPAPAAGAGRAFPAAPHRGLSKFALARRPAAGARANGGAAAASAPPPRGACTWRGMSPCWSWPWM